jgi:hypothetical protein
MVFSIAAAYFLYSGFATPTAIDEVSNLQLMHIQTINVSIGIACAIIASLFAVGASIVGAVRPEE